MLLLLSLAELLGMSLWFTASAVAPQLHEAWGLSAQQAGWLTTVVQLGFVGGTAAAAVLNLADLVPERPYFAVSAVCAALANALLVVAPGFAAVLLLRLLTGFFLAGVYPPAMKMIATWFRSGRGLAIGTVVGALTLGKATPYLLRALEGAALAPVVLTASAGAVLGALLVGLLYREGPFPFARRPFSWGLVGIVVRHRPTRLAIGGAPSSPVWISQEKSRGHEAFSMAPSCPRKRGICGGTDQARQGHQVDARDRCYGPTPRISLGERAEGRGPPIRSDTSDDSSSARAGRSPKPPGAVGRRQSL
jgi:MFS family permease